MGLAHLFAFCVALAIADGAALTTQERVAAHIASRRARDTGCHIEASTLFNKLTDSHISLLTGADIGNFDSANRNDLSDGFPSMLDRLRPEEADRGYAHLVLLNMPVSSDLFQTHWFVAVELPSLAGPMYHIFQAYGSAEQSYRLTMRNYSNIAKLPNVQHQDFHWYFALGIPSGAISSVTKAIKSTSLVSTKAARRIINAALKIGHPLSRDELTAYIRAIGPRELRTEADAKSANDAWKIFTGFKFKDDSIAYGVIPSPKVAAKKGTVAVPQPVRYPQTSIAILSAPVVPEVVAQPTVGSGPVAQEPKPVMIDAGPKPLPAVRDDATTSASSSGSAQQQSTASLTAAVTSMEEDVTRLLDLLW